MNIISEIGAYFKHLGGGSKGENELDKKTYDALESEAQEMIQSVVEFGDTTAKEVMVPRTDTVFLQADADADELLSTIAGSGHSRFPVYRDTIDNVIGIVYVKDALRCLVEKKSVDIEKLLHKPYFVPETKHIDDLLRELRRRRVHIAVVVDEYGGTSGIVCMEDIIEEIIGDIQDEFDNEREDSVPLGEGAWLCDTRANLEDLFDELDIPKPEGDFDTLGGFVFDLFGKIPVKYEKVSYSGYDFIIQEMEGHRIITVKIIKSDVDNEAS
jgi:CBS domain containing-hemolysin-like protein